MSKRVEPLRFGEQYVLQNCEHLGNDGSAVELVQVQGVNQFLVKDTKGNSYVVKRENLASLKKKYCVEATVWVEVEADSMTDAIEEAGKVLAFANQACDSFQWEANRADKLEDDSEWDSIEVEKGNNP